ncbi:MAG: DUF3857 domain-containing protein [Thermoanaerobaculia bacterium]|nr:DUF3857 domain-containing protein [Thermoanaerobaculia bacterium]
MSYRSTFVSCCPADLVIRPLLLALLILVAPSVPAEDDWLPVEASYDELTAEALPGVPAVVLFRKARLRFRDYPAEANSQLDVQVRIKILTEEGTGYGNAEVAHSRWVRLDDFEGRTIAADGRIVPLAADQIFEERVSRRGKEFVTKAAFPAVEPGAIVDFRYRLYWDNLFYLEPWYFQTELPTLLSEIVYIIPGRYAAQPWGIQTTTRKLNSEMNKVPQGRAVRVWIENAPKIPDEPFSPPSEVLSSRFMMVPKSINVGGQTVLLMDNWRSVSELFEDSYYLEFRRRDNDVKKLAKELTRGLANDREKAEAIFRHLRDEIRTVSGWGVWPSDSNANKALETRLATSAEKAVMMQIMLDAAKIDSDLVWAAHRDQGVVNLTVANPAWFDGVLVRVDVGEGPVFLDASDPGLAFGQLLPGYEGMAAVALHSKKPETLELPVSEPKDSSRVAELDLALDEDGRLSGTGSLIQTGHWAWRLIYGSDDMEAQAEAWEEILEKDFPTHDVTDVQVTEDADASQVTVTWSMAQREEEVLGDEVSFVPSAVLRTTQPFEAEKRLTPVQMDLHLDDSVKLELTWPEGWEIEAVPEMVDMLTPLGSYRVDLSWDEEARELSFLRSFQRPAGEYRSPEEYTTLLRLYDNAARSDASSITLFLP